MPEQAALPLAETPPPEVVRRFEIPEDAVILTQSNQAETVTPDDQNKEKQAPSATPDAKPDEPKKSDKPEEALTPEQAAERERKREGARYGRRLDKAYRERAEAQARADLLEQRLSALEKSQQPQAPSDAPTLAQFEYDPEKYANAKADYAKKQTEKEIQQKTQADTQKQHQQRLVSDWEEKVAAAEDKYDDFDPRIASIAPVTPMAAAIMEAENGVEIASYLLKNPKEDKRIGALPPLSQIREIGKLEAKLLSEPEKPKAPSKAPAPIVPLTGSATPESPLPSEEDDVGSWIKKRQKQVYGKRR